MTSSILNHTLPAAPARKARVTVRCEVTPGVVRQIDVPAEALERYVAVKLVAVPGKPGVYAPSVQEYAPLMPVTDDLGERMGWGLERRQILALGVAGMIKCYRATTGATLVDPVSVWDHIRSTALHDAQARAVWTPENVRVYSDAQDFVRSTGIVDSGRREKADAIPHAEFAFMEGGTGE